MREEQATMPDLADLRFDGWYAEREMAEEIAELLGEEGWGAVIGLVVAQDERWGIWYWVLKRNPITDTHVLAGSGSQRSSIVWPIERDRLIKARARTHE